MGENSAISSDLLKTIDYPADLRKLEEKQLPQLCEELRSFIIEAVSTNPVILGQV